MAGASDTIHVLHVDDEPDFADMAAAFLTREDDRFAVRTATSAAQGLDLLSDHDVDCVVSDYDMPGQNGVEFLKAVREEYPQLPFVLFTGKGSEEVASDAISAGVSDYLRKGSGSDRYSLLANRIRNLVAQQQAEAQLHTRAEQQQLVAALGRAALAGRPPDALFDQAVTMVADGLDNEYAKVLEYRSAHEDLLLRSGTGWQEGIVGEATVGTGADSQAGHTLRSAEPIVVEDLRTESRFRGPPFLVDHDVVSGISVIIGSPDDPWGVLGTHTTKQTAFSEEDITFVQNIANVLASALTRAEQDRELRRKERRYQAVFNDPNILVGLIDTDGTVLDVNETAMEYLDASLESVTGEPFWATPWFTHSEALQDEVKDWIDRASTGEYVEFTATLRTPDDEPYTVEGVIRPVLDDDGEVVSLLISDRDITEQRAHERELERTNVMLSTLFETLPVGVLVEDGDRNVLAVNSRLIELFGLPGAPEDAVGTDCAELAERVSDQFVDPKGFVSRINQLIAARDSVRTEELSLEDGRTFARDYEPVALPEGEGNLWLYRDITDRMEREQRRETTITFLQALYDVATDKTLDGYAKITRLLEVGQEILDLPPGYLTRIEMPDGTREAGTQRVIEASGNHELLQPGDVCPLWQSYCRKTIKTDQVVMIQDALAAGWKDDPAYELFDLGCYIGTAITVADELYGTVFFATKAPREEPFSEADRAFVRLMSQLVSYELERYQTRQELELQNERLDDFASVVSHDLRNPLNVAEGRLELGREVSDNEHFEHVARALDRMHVLIEDLLTLAREGEGATDMEPISLADCSDACWETVDTADATLRTPTDHTLLADRSKLQQLLENLYRNAIDHGGDAVTVTVGDLATGFYVEDDGLGIPEADRDAVFDVGYSTTPEGTGFGLSIVKQVVDAHGWEIDVTESAAGGARFEITGVEFRE